MRVLEKMRYTKDDLIWFTGFWEGEGSVLISKTTGCMESLSLYQKNCKILEKLRVLFGGKFSRVCHNRKTGRMLGRLTWRREGLSLLKAMFPYMRHPDRIEKISTVLENEKRHHSKLIKYGTTDRERHNYLISLGMKARWAIRKGENPRFPRL